MWTTLDMLVTAALADHAGATDGYRCGAATLPCDLLSSRP